MALYPQALIDQVVAARWVSPVTLAVESASFGPDGLTVGPETFGPTACLTLENGRLSVVRDGWRLETYLLYRPLVYFAAFGSEDVFACLHLAVTSLFEFGGYDGDVLLLTDEANLSWPDILPEAVRPRVHMQAIAAADMLDWTLARYRVVDLPELRQFRPFLYLDADMVCNAPLDVLLRMLAISTVLHAPGENPVMQPEDYYGASLFVADGVKLPAARQGFSTGMLGFPDLETVAPLFTVIPQLAQGHASAVGSRTVFDCFDQPFANYAVVKAGSCETRLLGSFLDNRHYWHPRPDTRRGLTHFTGGTGAASAKLQAMAAYVEQLRFKPDVTGAPPPAAADR